LSRRSKKGMNTDDIKFWGIVGLAGVGAYLLYQTYKGAGNVASAVVGAPAAVGTSLSNTLFDWLNPYAANDTYYTVTFGDGSRHAIHSTDVSADGSFTYQGASYVLKMDSAGQRYATIPGMNGYRGLNAAGFAMDEDDNTLLWVLLGAAAMYFLMRRTPTTAPIAPAMSRLPAPRTPGVTQNADGSLTVTEPPLPEVAVPAYYPAAMWRYRANRTVSSIPSACRPMNSHRSTRDEDSS